MSINLLAVNLTVQSLKMRIWYLCQGMRLIERRSPSRKDGIDALQAIRLQYLYCHFLRKSLNSARNTTNHYQNSHGPVPQVLVRKTHACHYRFMISTDALFLAVKSEETPCPMNNVLRSSCEILHNQYFDSLLYRSPVS